MYHNFIGIDIGKFEFYSSVHGETQTHCHKNTSSGIETYLEQNAKTLSTALVILETTGGYESALIEALQAKGYAVHRANTRRVKHFIRSLGKLGKTDNLDAQALARYGHDRHSDLPLYQPNPQEALQKLVNRREELTQMLVKEKNRLQAPTQEVVMPSIERMLGYLQGEIETINQQIQKLFASNPELLELRKVLMSIPGIGEIVASNLIALMPELGHVNRKQIASLAGVAPHPNDSGTKVGYRFTRGGRAEVKRILFIAAMSASRSRAELGDFYRRLTQTDKKKMVALTALMRKIIVIANARVRDYLVEKNNLTSNDICMSSS